MHRLPNPIKKPLLLCLLPLALGFSSCVESEVLFILNPDGSGRATTREKIPTAELGITGNAALEQVAMSTLAEFIITSEGVDAWEKVSYSISAEGDVTVEATALFPDLKKLKLASTASSPTLATGLKFTPAKGGQASTIRLQSPIAAAGQQETIQSAPPTDDEISTAIAKSRKDWAQNEENIRKSIGKQRAKITFHLPGSIDSQNNFNKDARNQVSLEVSSHKMIDVLETVIQDDDLATGILKTGARLMDNTGPPPIDSALFNKLAFGNAAPIEVNYQATNPIFDYRAAVERAKAEPSKLLETILEEIKQR